MRATSSLPVPLSPMTKILVLVDATLLIKCKSALIGGASPKMRSPDELPMRLRASSGPCDFEDRQIHRDHQTADCSAKENQNKRFHKFRERPHCDFDFFFIEVRDLLQHFIERTGRFTHA